MKRCITAHHVDTFGDIPEGSLWADDSPYVLDENADKFTAVVEAEPEKAPPKKRAATRKFGEKKGDD